MSSGSAGALFVVNPNLNEDITALIDTQVRAAAGVDVEVRTLSPRWGPLAVESRVDGSVATVAVLDLLSELPSPDGVLIAAFADPGLEAARELLDVPVVGIGEAGLAAAAEWGEFAVLTVQPASVPAIEQRVRMLGLSDVCRQIVAAPASVEEASRPADVRERIIRTADAMVGAGGIAAVCLAGAPLGVFAQELRERVGIEFVSPVAAGVHELLRRMRIGSSGWGDPAYQSIGPRSFAGAFDFLERIDHRLMRRRAELSRISEPASGTAMSSESRRTHGR